jgi:hypothetical protein
MDDHALAAALVAEAGALLLDIRAEGDRRSNELRRSGRLADPL